MTIFSLCNIKKEKYEPRFAERGNHYRRKPAPLAAQTDGFAPMHKTLLKALTRTSISNGRQICRLALCLCQSSSRKFFTSRRETNKADLIDGHFQHIEADDGFPDDGLSDSAIPLMTS